jgi:hypothetical protein
MPNIPLRPWHERWCLAYTFMHGEEDCECGGAERHRKEMARRYQRALHNREYARKLSGYHR